MYEYKGPIKFWYDLFPSIVVILICCGIFCCPFLFVAGCEEKVDANTRKMYADPEATWMFEGTFCSKCNQLYNYIEHPKICDKCGLETKDFYYLALIKERK